MRFLFVTWDGGGNLAPKLVLARRLLERGDDVRFLGHRCQEAAVRHAGCDFSAYEQAPDWDFTRPETAAFPDWELSPLRLFAAAREKLLFGPASVFAGDVLAEVDRHGPDAVAADCFLFGALAAAERSGLPSAALWHTVYTRSDWDTPADGLGLPLARGWPGKLRDRALKMVEASLWNKGLPALNAARAGLGLDPLDTVFEQWDRADRVLVMTSSAFDFACLAGTALPENVRYVGPQVEIGSLDRTSRAASSDRPLVLVSFSTSYQAQEPLLRRVVAALGALPVRVLVTTGRAVELTGSLPANVEVRRWVPHAEVLPEAALVVTHAGMGTAMAALAHGVPLVCLPMGRDQLDVAARVVHAGAGLRLSPKVGERRIAAAVREALARPELGQNAERLGRAIRDEISADRGVAELVRLAGTRIAANSEPVSGAVSGEPGVHS